LPVVFYAVVARIGPHVWTTLGPYLMRDGERAARLLTSRPASNGYKPAATSGIVLPHFFAMADRLLVFDKDAADAVDTASFSSKTAK
jgi:hypothetical protein